MEVMRQHLLGLLDETWHGAPLPGWEEGWSYYSDMRTGFDQTCAALTAEQALRSVGSTSIAQHVAHTAFGARTFAMWLRGGTDRVDWLSSFNVDTAAGAEAAWRALRAELDSALAELRLAIEQADFDTERNPRAATGAVAHAVYHLGAVRTKLTAVR
jgi:hypothetical protein